MLVAVQETKAKLPIELLTRQYSERIILRYCTYFKINYNLRTESGVIPIYFFPFLFLYESLLLFWRLHASFLLCIVSTLFPNFLLPFYLSPLIPSSLISSLSIFLFHFFVS